jgi:hypothetical protein
MFKAIPQKTFCKAIQDLRHFCVHTFHRHKMGSFDHGLDLWEEVAVAGERSGEKGGCSSTVMFLLVKHCFTENVLWAGMLSWCKIHPFLHNAGYFLLTCSRNFVDFNVILLIYCLATG